MRREARKYLYDIQRAVLFGGTKVRQQRDIENAHELWREYRRRKQQEA